jgi:hypothetical protein
MKGLIPCHFHHPASPLPGSKGDTDHPPRWYRPGVLGEVIERSNRLYFVPSRTHPALRDSDETYCGIEGEVGTAANIERCFRDALARKKAWKAAKKIDRAERAAELLKAAA